VVTMSSNRNKRPGELTTEEILDWCKNGCPVNCDVDNAIAAHRIAFERYQNNGEQAEYVAMCALRALMLSAAKFAAEDEAKLDYLSSLPIEAWESDVVHTRFDMRDETLAMVRNHLASWATRV
jgi:hypothetical protein